MALARRRDLSRLTLKESLWMFMRIDSRETVADEKDQLGGWQGRKLAQTPVVAEEVRRRCWILD